MIRSAVSGSFVLGHLSVRSNLVFFFRNFLDILLLYLFTLLDFLLVIIVDLILAATVVLIPLIPIVTTYMFYWATGYEYGQLAKLMREQQPQSFVHAARKLGRRGASLNDQVTPA
ncbi:MAG: hypothetical protein AAFZ18_35850 [Myxococcota bacterium]